MAMFVHLYTFFVIAQMFQLYTCDVVGKTMRRTIAWEREVKQSHIHWRARAPMELMNEREVLEVGGQRRWERLISRQRDSRIEGGEAYQGCGTIFLARQLCAWQLLAVEKFEGKSVAIERCENGHNSGLLKWQPCDREWDIRPQTSNSPSRLHLHHWIGPKGAG